jgi:hypothetical protein
MFDSIKLYLPQERAGTTDMLAQTPVFLQNITEHTKAGQIHYSGYLNNLSIYVSDRGVSVKGSLAKYHLDDNLKTLTRKDTEQAIDSLSDELHLPMQKADVSRIDFAQNFIMKYEPKTYYSYLGESQFFKRFTNPKSLYYKNGNRTKLFYDKQSEAKSKAVNIPELLKESNILRYEIRYKRRLGKQLNEPEITAKTLYKEQFYIKLIDRYILDYQSIHKNVKHDSLESVFNEAMMSTPKDVKDQLAIIGLMAIGQNRFTELVEEWRAKDVLSKPEYYSRLKRDIRELSKEIEDSGSNPLIQELDSKVSALKRYYR